MISILGVGVTTACGFGVAVAPKTMKFCWAVAVACGTGVLTAAGVPPAPNMERTIMAMMMIRMTIRPKAMIIGVRSALFLPPRLPLV